MPHAHAPPLNRLPPEEAAQVLRLLLRRHRSLVAEAAALADKALGKVNMERIAREVTLAVEGVG